MNIIIRILIQFVLLNVLINTCSLAEEVRYFIDTTVNVRKSPDISSGIIGNLTKSQEIKLIEKTDIITKLDDSYAYWVKIQFNNDIVGFVFGGFINCKYYFDNESFIERKQFAIDIINLGTKIMVVDSLANLHEFPSSNSAIISTTNIGDTFSSVKYAFTEESIKENKFWYYIKAAKFEGFLPGNNVMTGIMKINSYYYGVNEYPISFDDPWEHRYVQTNSKIVVFSKSLNTVIQRFVMPDSTDCIRIIDDSRFSKILSNKIIIVEHSWNQFTCCPIGYQGNLIYSLDNEGKITKKIFSWFKDMGAQDSPSANLEDINVSDFKIVLDYDYTESSGLQGMGEGKIKILYYVYKGAVFFNKIESSVIQTYKVIDGSFMYDDEHKLKVPVNLKYTKDELNAKFLYLSKVNLFVY